MSKAEERAMEAYPDYRSMDGGYITQRNKRMVYIEGYHQAEKDLELDWKDIMIIHRCIKDAMNYHIYKMMEGIEGQKVVYQEVLKRFKAMKYE